MKALRAHRRGGAEQFSVEDAPMPTVGPGDVLVAVHAAGITFAEFDWDLSWTGLDGTDRTPVVPAHEFSGTIASVGISGSGLREGDGVFGLVPFHRDGAAAEYVAVPIENLVGKPRALSHIDSAAVPLAALTSWQALFDHAHLQSGERILIQGAAGGVGSAAVQLAVACDAEVIATARAADVEFVRALGATCVIDVEAGPFESGLAPVDVVLDTVGGETLRRSFGVMRSGGRLVTLSAPPDQNLAAEVGVTAVFFVVESNRAELAAIVRMIDSGALRPIVCQTFPLDQGRAAYESGRVRRPPGKTVLTIRP